MTIQQFIELVEDNNVDKSFPLVVCTDIDKFFEKANMLTEEVNFITCIRNDENKHGLLLTPYSIENIVPYSNENVINDD